MSVDKDVATVLALEEPAAVLQKAIKAAQPAIKRLREAKYPGAEWVSVQQDDEPDHDGTPLRLAGALKMFRESGGDLGTFAYLFYVKELGLNLADAAKEILDADDNDDANMRRVEAMRQYAATVA